MLLSVVGFDVDTGKAIAEKLSVELNYVTSDWDGLIEELMLAGDLLRLEEMAIAVNKDDVELLEKLNTILTELHEDGTMTEVSKKWHNGEDITVK